jgi:hypothetical protein
MLGLDHSYSDLGTEYGDPYDVMSDDGTYSISTPYGQGSPEMNVMNKEWVGFLPASRIQTLTADGKKLRTTYINIAAINRPEVNAPLSVKIYYPSTVGSYFTVEFREPTGWDAGMPNSGVLIHDYRVGKSLLKTNPVQLFTPSTAAFSSSGVTIQTTYIDDVNGYAQIKLTY